MKRNGNVLVRKGLLLLALLAMLALTTAAGLPRSAEAWGCDPLPCPTDMHWDWWQCACVCDCFNCGPCN